MSATLHIENTVRDFASWKQAFDAYARFRVDGGVRAHRVSRRADQPDHVAIDLDFDTADDAAAFHERLRAVWASPRSQAELVDHAVGVVYEVVEWTSPG